MVRLPRDLSGRDLARAVRRYGYEVTRETGSHMRLTTQQGGEHHITIPDHASADIAAHFKIDRSALAAELFER